MYSDIEHVEITDEQYKANIVYQYPHLDESLSVSELEFLVDILQIPYNNRLAIIQAIHSLPILVQRRILGELVL
jgi:hypothetical protein